MALFAFFLHAATCELLSELRMRTMVCMIGRWGHGLDERADAAQPLA